MFFLLLSFGFYLFLVWPSLSGGFVLDDWPNLANLTHVRATGNVWGYSLSGIASSLGRPLSYLTFALQADNWSKNPLPFKTVNICIHLFNAILLYLICHFLSLLLSFSIKKRMWFALLVTCFWLYLPLHASTVFYVVQRMTLLAGTFSLLGLLFYLQGYWLFGSGHKVKGAVVATLGVGFGYLCGVLSKENGVLLGVFILVIHFQCLPKPKVNPIFWRNWALLVGLLPVVLTIIYLSINNRYMSGYGIRDFDMTERLMTESIILWDYLLKTIIPTPSGLNIFNDDFPVSRNFWGAPFISVTAWIICLTVAFRLKNITPYLLFGLLWFLGGHLLESSFLGLELYFEHRNYIPSIGIVIAAVLSGVHLWDKVQGSKIRVNPFKVAVGLYVSLSVILFCVVLRVEATTWGSGEQFTKASIADRPNSLRAWMEAASYYGNQRDIATAAKLLYYINDRWPNYPGVLASQMLLHCFDEAVVLADKPEQLRRMEFGQFDRGVTPSLEQVLSVKKQGGCKDISWSDFRDILNAVLRNPNLHGTTRENVIVLISYSYNAEEKYKEAALALDQKNVDKADIKFLLLKSKFKAMAGSENEALQIIQLIRKEFSQHPRIWLPNKGAVDRLEVAIEEKIQLDQEEVNLPNER